MSVCVPHPNFGCLIQHCVLFCRNASRVYASGPGPWEVSPASSRTLQIVTHDDKVKCEWIVNSNAGSEDAGSMSGAVASLSQVPSSPVVASSSQVSCSSPPQHETCASVYALQEIAEVIHDVQHGHDEHLWQVEDNAHHSLDAVEWLVQVLVNGGALKVAEQALVSSVGGSQHSNGTLLLVDYDQELLVESEGGGDVGTS